MTSPVRLGLLRLTDSAPAVLADAEGLYAAAGLDVALQVEPSWANVADKLAWGKLDAAIMLPPLALAAAAGLRGMRTRLHVTMGISQGGNAVVVGRAAAAALPATPLDAAAAGRALGVWLRDQASPPRFAVVHVFSTHNLLLRHWLAACGVDPDRDIETVVVPPERVVAALEAGQIAGFCAGAPWGDYAAETGAGRVLLGSSAIRPRHPEKCLAVSAAWAGQRPEAAKALTVALYRAQHLCDRPDRAPALAALMASRLGLPESATRAALPGGSGPEQIGFAVAARLDPTDALWFLREMRRWGWLDAGQDIAALAAETYRPATLLEA
ncbi:MAG: CmpA/NrtA family ABC transporter substrate-binding protein [Acetobacteraceae bacterium]|jgi:ABC-type nitrate/sulfonate/bicarbonate transport system substrate-binding protein